MLLHLSSAFILHPSDPIRPPGLTHLFPAVEVHAGQFAVVRLSDVDVQGLALVDEGAAVGGHLQHGLLGDFPHGFVQLLQIVWNLIDVLLKQAKVIMQNKKEILNTFTAKFRTVTTLNY